MMRYYKNIADGYISSLEKRESQSSGTEISEAEYAQIMAVLKKSPSAPDGFGYRLTESLEWELYQLPIEEVDEEATTEDYEAALREMGVEV